MKLTMCLLAAALLSVASCSRDSATSDPATAEAQATTTSTLQPINVRIYADQSGLSGCTASVTRAGEGIGNGQRLTVEDEGGTRLGVGTMERRPGTEICDWVVRIPDVPEARLYTFIAGSELLTMSLEEMQRERWRPVLHISSIGSVTLE